MLGGNTVKLWGYRKAGVGGGPRITSVMDRSMGVCPLGYRWSSRKALLAPLSRGYGYNPPGCVVTMLRNGAEP
jgi:hypothetical protein